MNRLSILFLLVLLPVLGCGEPAADATRDGTPAGTDPTVLDADSSDSVADSVPEAAAEEEAAAAEADTGLTTPDPFLGFELDADPADTVERRIALLLRNQDTRMAVVYADGGAGEVFLDSVAPGSDTRVDVVSRAAAISLRSVTPSGELLRETEVAPGPDTIVEVIVGAAPASP